MLVIGRGGGRGGCGCWLCVHGRSPYSGTTIALYWYRQFLPSSVHLCAGHLASFRSYNLKPKNVADNGMSLSPTRTRLRIPNSISNATYPNLWPVPTPPHPKLIRLGSTPEPAVKLDPSLVCVPASREGTVKVVPPTPPEPLPVLAYDAECEEAASFAASSRAWSLYDEYRSDERINTTPPRQPTNQSAKPSTNHTRRHQPTPAARTSFEEAEPQKETRKQSGKIQHTGHAHNRQGGPAGQDPAQALDLALGIGIERDGDFVVEFLDGGLHGALVHADGHLAVVEEALEVVLAGEQVLGQLLVEDVDFVLQVGALRAQGVGGRGAGVLELGAEFGAGGAEEVRLLFFWFARAVRGGMGDGVTERGGGGKGGDGHFQRPIC